MAEHGLRQPVLGLALDGVGLGSDGTAWGGELLQLDGAQMSRLGHLWPLALPGGDAAASQPWRMAASVLHAVGRSAELETRFGPVVGVPAARMLRGMLDQSINCPHTSSMGRWFDAAAGALGLSVRQCREAEAAMALEQAAAIWLRDGRSVNDLLDQVPDDLSILDLRPLMLPLLDGNTSAGEGAAQFHVSLASVLARWVAHASQQTGLRTICLSGGCFANAVLRTRLCADLAQRGIQVYTAQTFACGDAGIALGQAWVVSRQREANANVNFSAQTPTAVSVHHDQPEATSCA
jgi:hydrogenase maturation protein HypF